MVITRRQCVVGGTALFAWRPIEVSAKAKEAACNPGSAPRIAKFESGDLLWPKRPGAYIPYSSESASTLASDKARWELERDQFVRRLTLEGQPTDYQLRLAAELRHMTFEQFYSRYINSARPGENVPFGGGTVGFGHVAILDCSSHANPHVIEAMPWKGVVRVPYVNWVAERACDLIWQGRLDGMPIKLRTGIAAHALQLLGRPYDFWNLSLDDEHGFYCSKLVWLSVFKATALALDGQSETQRAFWVSPKQLLYAKKIVRLHNPGDYTRR